MPGFKIDFSDDDLKAEGSSAVFEAVPAGDYPCIISDLELVEVKSGDNAGKLMFKATLTVEDEESPYNNRKFWCNLMLFTVYGKDGKPNNFFLSQFLKATGNADALETGVVPEADAFIGKKLLANVKRVRNTYNVADGDPITYKNEVKGFQPLTVETVAKGKARKTNSLLP